MRVLIFCNCYNVLMASIQARRYYFSKDDVDIVLGDFANNMESICANLKQTNIFSNVYFAQIKEKYQGGNLYYKIRKSFFLIEKSEKLIGKLGIDTLQYDQYIFNNYDLMGSQIYLNLKKYNKKIRCSRIEEGYSTYTLKNRFKKLAAIMKVICFFRNINTLEASTKDIYLYEPDLLMYDNSYTKYRLPKYSRKKDDICLLNYIFGYKDEAKKYEKYRYIFFEESFFKDKAENIDDFTVFTEIIKVLKKEEVILRLHPRTDVNRFKGIEVDKGNLPWEIIQLNGDFKQTYFITISSGSVLATKLWLEDEVKTIFLFNCTNKRPMLVDNNYLSYINAILSNDTNGNWFIPDNVENAIKILS